MHDEILPEDRPFIMATEKGKFIFVEMGGVINAQTLPESRKLVDEIIESHKIYKKRNLRILVDYKMVKSIDSSTIANILQRLGEHKEFGHQVAFINIPKELKDLIILHKLEDQIKIYKNKTAALKEFKKATQ